MPRGGAHRGGERGLIQTTRGPTLEDLRARREKILHIANAYGASNVRVFGSVARGEAGPESDVDLLVDIATDRRGFAFFGLLEELLGWPLDVGEAVRPQVGDDVARDLVAL